MNQQPDKFFREKLEGYQKAAPASAWEKIAAAQAKKNNKGLWLKIAASLLFLVVAGFVIWTKIVSNHREPSTITTAQPEIIPVPLHETEKQSSAKTNIKQPQVSDKSTAEKQTLSSIQKINRKKPDTKDNKIIVRPNVGQEVSEKPNVNEQSEEEDDLVLPLHESIETSVASEAAPVHGEGSKNIKLVFTVKEADEYLDKKSLAQATSDDKKPSTLKKLLKKANDLGSQDPFGELRQKKNEILALNFKNEKRGQNK